jgi:hypothetical protein
MWHMLSHGLLRTKCISYCSFEGAYVCYLMASSIDRAGKNEDDEEGYIAGVGDAQEAPTLKSWEQVALRHAAADDGLGGGDVF